MNFASFLKYQIRFYLLRGRWLLSLPVMGFIAYRSINAVNALSAMTGHPVNAWDATFYAFGSADVVYMVLAVIFLALVSDLLPEPAYGQSMMMRLGSRRLWWLGKSLTLVAATLGYLIINLLTFLLFVGAALPWARDWSEYTRSDFIAVGLYKDVMLITPLKTFTYLVVLLALGLFCLGLISVTVTLAARRNVVGFLAGAGVLLSGYIGTTFAGSVTSWLMNFLITNHFELTPGVFPIRNIPIGMSVLYWITAIIVLGIIGLTLSRKQDFIAIEDQ
jgi:hypothetical protein